MMLIMIMVIVMMLLIHGAHIDQKVIDEQEYGENDDHDGDKNC